MSTWKPKGYNSASPYLITSDAAATVAFLKSAFGGTELRRFDRPDGKIQHVEVRIDDSVIMMGDAVEGWPATPSHVHVYVADVDAVYEKALQAGATTVQPPAQKDDGDKRGGIKDAGGTTWWIATGKPD